MAIPIPRLASGFALGSTNPKVSLDVFFDIQCPHSKTAWPRICELLDYYEGQPVGLRAHLITLSNHRQAWDMSLGLFAFSGDDAQKFRDFATYMFEHQNEFSNRAFEYKTHDDLRSLVADYAVSHGNVDREAFLNRLTSHDVYIDARTPIRFAATRSVWATPTFFINNADNVPVTFDSTIEDWIDTIDGLLNT